MNWPCTLCGRTDWPREDATCPLCYKEPEQDDNEEDYDPDFDSHDEMTYNEI
jgi:hypothetical protein